MASLLDLRRRIRATESTQQLTKAMHTVAASKLRKAQDRIIGARPFAQLMQKVLSHLSSATETTADPLLASPIVPDAPVLLIVVTADKGLCGSFNSSLLRKAHSFLEDSDVDVILGLVGRRGRDHFARRRTEILFERVNFFNSLSPSDAQEMARVAIERYASGKVSGVSIIYNEFKNVIQQEVVVEQLLPIPEPEGNADELSADYLYEPDPQVILSDLVPRHIETQLFRVLLESDAAFLAAQMTAMDAASKNAGEMIDELTLHMNKLRQAAITRELIEVVSGADAL